MKDAWEEEVWLSQPAASSCLQLQVALPRYICAVRWDKESSLLWERVAALPWRLLCFPAGFVFVLLLVLVLCLAVAEQSAGKGQAISAGRLRAVRFVSL